MTCGDCGGEMTSRRENHPYRIHGLDQVRLRNVEVLHCTACGEWEAVIPRMEELHRALMAAAATDPVPRRIELVFDSTWKAA